MAHLTRGMVGKRLLYSELVDSDMSQKEWVTERAKCNMRDLLQDLADRVKHVQNKGGWTALYWAAEAGHTEIVNLGFYVGTGQPNLGAVLLPRLIHLRRLTHIIVRGQPILRPYIVDGTGLI